MNPFESHSFFQALKESGATDEKMGHREKLFKKDESYLYGFIKEHSYGEYIFDWGWAQAYERYGLAYYPKLIHYTPYTPVNAHKFIGEKKRELMEQAWEFYQQETVSSHHYLFIQPEEVELLEEKYLIRDSLQYHFHNEFDSFEDYLEKLNKNKRKTIKKERAQVEKHGLEIKRQLINELSDEEIREIYHFYLTTVAKKNAFAYLRSETFLAFKKYLPKQTMVIRAFQDEELMGMSLFFISEEAIYGRYWGCHPCFERSFLHFELCYYQGIDYVIENNIPLFEAGAQGEQKLIRGFKPVIIKSAHHLKHPEMHQAVRNFIEEERQYLKIEFEKCVSLLPFKKSLG